METTDFIICGVLIALCLGIGIAWIVTKGNFVKTTRTLSEYELNVRKRRSVFAGIFYILIAVLIAITMVAVNYQISWLMITCFALILVCCVAFILLTRLIYRRR